MRPLATAISRYPLAMRMALALLSLVVLRMLGAGIPNEGIKRLWPMPDAPEQVYMSLAAAKASSPLLPIGNELHPSRYSPIVSWIAVPWILQRGPAIRSVLEWSAVATSLALLAQLALLARLGAGLLGAALFCFIFVTSPNVLQMSQLPMQEATLALLMSAAALLAFIAADRQDSPGGSRGNRDAIALGAWFGCGVMAGAMTVARGSLCTFPLAIAVFLLLPRPRFLPLTALAAGCLLPPIATIISNYHWSGRLYLLGYYHWIPGFQPFELANAFRPPVNANELGTSQWQSVLYGAELLGYRRALSNAGLPLTAAVIAAGFGAFRLRDSSQRRLCIAMTLFAWSQVAAQAFYKYYDARFLVMPFLMLTLVGIACLSKLTAPDSSIRGVAVLRGLAVAVSLVSILVSGQVWGTWAMARFEEARTSSQTANMPSAYLPTVEDGAWLRQQPWPAYIWGAPVVSARISMDLLEWKVPIFQMQRVRWHLEDCHIDQMWTHQVGASFATLQDAKEWPGRPNEQFLLDPHGDAGAEPERIVQAVRGHGGVSVLIASEQRDAIARLNGALGASGLSHETTTSGQWLRIRAHLL